MKTKISIAICTYNGEKYLTKQLDSILGQSRVPNEIVVCDDGSTDKTLEILKGYQEKFPNVFKVFVNPKNLGYYKNFEKAIYHCSEDFIITSDQDDIWKNNKVEITQQFFEENPQFDGVFNDLEIINDNEETLEPSYLNWKHISYDFVEKNIQEKTLFVQQQMMGSFVLGCALAIRKTALEKYQLKDFVVAHDFFIAQKLTAKHKLGFIPKSLSKYRQHEDQVCGLRISPDSKETTNVTPAKASKFHEMVWPYLSASRKYHELYPLESEKESFYYQLFIKQRDIYLKSLPFFVRKKYLLQCIRHNYLDLQFLDFFKY